jgi:DNA-directed RNA polymerase specialized sigma24 family protein
VPVEDDMPSTTHLSLIDGLRGEDSAAWERFARDYRPWLVDFAIHHFHFHAQDAEDVVQHVMTDLFQEFRKQKAGTRPAFEHNGRAGAFRSWVRGITRHRALAFLRSGRLRQPVPHGEELLAQLKDARTPLSLLWIEQHDRQMIHQAWAAIQGEFDPSVWRPVGEILFKERRAPEVARELHVSLRTLYSHRKVILDRLRDLLDGLIDE